MVNAAAASRTRSLAIVTVSYLIALAAALATAALLRGHHPLVVGLAADVVATLVIFGLSMLLDNASLYDPYWSVAPPVLAVGWLVVTPGETGRRIAVVALIAIWAVRLTGNWVRGWSGLGHEDWRYRQLRTTRGKVPWWLVNLGGIQLMPTLLVFLGMLPVWPALSGRGPLGPLDVLAAIVTAVAIGVETAADRQRHRFAADPANRTRVADVGLWRLSRHPNYLGEIGLWWGLWLFGLAGGAGWWWTVVGPLGMVVLFVFASIPMMDRRSLQRRPGYAAYMASVPALLPWPRRRERTAGAP
jgi:steroid 5-alpha reductase family enzyme